MQHIVDAFNDVSGLQNAEQAEVLDGIKTMIADGGANMEVTMTHIAHTAMEEACGAIYSAHEHNLKGALEQELDELIAMCRGGEDPRLNAQCPCHNAGRETADEEYRRKRCGYPR